jgi:hypothetical protein
MSREIADWHIYANEAKEGGLTHMSRIIKFKKTIHFFSADIEFISIL